MGGVNPQVRDRMVEGETQHVFPYGVQKTIGEWGRIELREKSPTLV